MKNYKILLVLLLMSGYLMAATNWHDNERNYRVFVNFSSGSVKFVDKPSETNLNFTEYLQNKGNFNNFDPSSLNVVEVNSEGTLLDSSVDFQFDQDADYDASTQASGNLTIIVSGTTNTETTRYYHVYFDVVGKTYSEPSITKQIYISEVNYKSQSSFKIETGSADYYYHKRGGGFASMIDNQGKDWVMWEPSGTNVKQSYRGFPNLGDVAHPGYNNGSPESYNKGANSTLTLDGKIKSTIVSVTDDNVWEWKWDFYPNYIVMTLVKKDPSRNYWFCYEGVPGGTWQPDLDTYVTSENIERFVAQSRTTGDLANSEYAFFKDHDLTRSLFLANHNNDDKNDFYNMLSELLNGTTDAENSALFQFGRAQSYNANFNNWRLLTQENAKFSYGFVESKDNTTVTEFIASVMNSMSVQITEDDEALPVELTSFSASVNDNSVELVWSTATEVNNYGFEIQRNGEKIGFVQGVGNSNSPLSYSYRDNNLSGGKYSYRLKQIDFDGKFEFSKAIEISIKQPGKFELDQNYPNPFNPATTISYSIEKAGNVRLSVFNVIGEEVALLVDESKEPGRYNVNFDASNLNSGIYFYRVTSNGSTQMKKMILIK